MKSERALSLLLHHYFSTHFEFLLSLVLLIQILPPLSNMMYCNSVDTEYPLKCWICCFWCSIWLQINSRFSKSCVSCMLYGVIPFTGVCFLASVLNLVSVFSLSAVWVVMPRVRQMRRLLWWALTTVTLPCRSASVRSLEITAVLRRENRPAARSEFPFLSALTPFFVLRLIFFKVVDLKTPQIWKITQ